ncbi:MAG: YccF domain-containing protein [Dysgonomonas sp.]
MKTIGNIIWFIFGGFMIAIEYFIASVALMITIIGIPFGIQTIKLGVLSLWPFGSKVVVREDTSGCLNLIMNIIWIIIGGFWIALTHLGWGILFCITIIGIPFGMQHFKLIRLALFPFGKEVVTE